MFELMPNHQPRSRTFESYGVTLKIESGDDSLLEMLIGRARKAMVGHFKPVETVSPQHLFRVNQESDGTFVLDLNGVVVRHGTELDSFIKYFDGMIRVTVAEYAKDRVFVHAGVVGWKGKAIVVPADSFGGKTTLTAEFVKNGAVYYSDDYAVFDFDGYVHPFPRLMSIRNGGKNRSRIDITEVSAASLGGKTGSEPLPVGAVLLTRYEENAVWEPQFLSPGQAALEMISQTIPIRYAPDDALKVLNKVTRHAIIAKSLRNDAKDFAKFFLEFIDNKAF